ECGHLDAWSWLGFGFRRKRRTVDKSLGHHRRLRRNRSIGCDGVVAAPITSANVERKTDHANRNDRHVAISKNPLRQQTAQSPWRLFGSFPFSRLHRQEKCDESRW